MSAPSVFEPEEQRMGTIWPWQDRNGRLSFLKAITFAALFLPGLWIVYAVETRTFGATPLAGMTFWSGVWATSFLLFALAVTPAIAVLRWNRLLVLRRMVGVAGFVYTVAHIFIYFALRFWDFASIGYEVVTRISLILAVVSTIGLLALTATSLDSAVKRMGADAWQRLHNIVYAVTALALVHFLLSPDIYTQQYLLSGMFFWLMVWRWLQKRGHGANAAVLAVLAVVTSLLTAFLEAGWIWVYQGFDPADTLANNFTLDLGISAAWYNLGLGLLIALLAAVRQAPRAMASGDQITSA
jgi:methionine sulfoxide reductase heme-binding subunit